MKKQSKAAQIRALLTDGVSVKDIAKKLKFAEPYVAQVRWAWKKNTGKPVRAYKKKAKDRTKMKPTKLKDIVKEMKAWQDSPEFEVKQVSVPYKFGDALPKKEGVATPQPYDPVQYWKDVREKMEKGNDEMREYIRDRLKTDERGILYGHESEWPTPPEPDMVNSPNHYTVGGIETIDFIEAKQLGYHLGNAVKYISRAPHKGREIEDLKKAVWYINREIERLEADKHDNFNIEGAT